MTPNDTSRRVALAILSVGLDDPNLDIGNSVVLFQVAVRAAVPSYCGLVITLVTDGMPVALSDLDHGDDGTAVAEVLASLVVPLSAIGPPAGGELTLFASAARAFVDLAADMAYATATDLITSSWTPTCDRRRRSRSG